MRLWAVLILIGFIGVLNTARLKAERWKFGPAPNSTEARYLSPEALCEIALDRQRIHPFLQEYERTLIVRTGNEETLRIKAAVDTGGYSRMRLYRVSPTEFYLEGFLSFDRFFLDISKPSVTREILASRPFGAKLIGSFDEDDKGWRFIKANT